MMPKAKHLQQASELYEEFSGHAGELIGTIDFPEHDTVIYVGKIHAIAYEAVRDGRLEKYVHEFKARSRPVLAVSHDGNQLYIVAGRYRFTDHGIVDY